MIIYTLGLYGIFELLNNCSKDDPVSQADPVILPETYTFKNNNSSSVDFAEQSDRLRMAIELEEVLKPTLDFNSELLYGGKPVELFNNNDYNFKLFLSLNDSSLKIVDKISVSNKSNSYNIKDSFTQFITSASEKFSDDWLKMIFPSSDTLSFIGNYYDFGEQYPYTINADSINLFVENDSEYIMEDEIGNHFQFKLGNEDNAGFLLDPLETKNIIYVNENGLDIKQYIMIGIVGAMICDQINWNLLDIDILSSKENTKLVDGKNYTEMEHAWDQAYGYLYALQDHNVIGADGVEYKDVLLLKYLNEITSNNLLPGLELEILNAFKLGRAAIIKNNDEERNKQAKIIYNGISKIIGKMASYYLGKAADERLKILNNSTSNPYNLCRELSKSYGFIYCLQFTRNPDTDEPFFSNEYVNNMLNSISDFWKVDHADIINLKRIIDTKFDF